MVKNNRNIVLILDNIRSAHNVGSLFRTAEGLGLRKIYLCGITPYPKVLNDSRLPHQILKATKQIDKTALGSVDLISYDYYKEALKLVNELKKDNYLILALEQAKDSIFLDQIKTSSSKIALIVGNEINGVEQKVLNSCHHIIEIKMFGKKESFNVVQAAAMALFYFTLF